ncbi:MAG: DNA-directed RNA polymerases I, II, and III subunit RPABC3 [Streblomastix strix]|uniref:DNA-directed RNA polymerases I, II, and III subunit RPABC3 n=2 Tax=Streblomastix strix TaxID=222440 RepID=A0A5J4UME3_9EUKA|nr:MAG: DNA-directed RNA polymerases I, II, and III subunit RPABC3 [Streblomastix strix]
MAEENDDAQFDPAENMEDENPDEEGEDVQGDEIDLVQPQERRFSALKERTTRPFLTKYERTRILGARALQISLNAPLLTDPGKLTDPLLIADLELRDKKIPIIIRRYLPSGDYEDWSLNELDIDVYR